MLARKTAARARVKSMCKGMISIQQSATDTLESALNPNSGFAPFSGPLRRSYCRVPFAGPPRGSQSRVPLPGRFSGSHTFRVPFRGPRTQEVNAVAILFKVNIPNPVTPYFRHNVIRGLISNNPLILERPDSSLDLKFSKDVL